MYCPQLMMSSEREKERKRRALIIAALNPTNPTPPPYVKGVCRVHL
jgi:hypothetical protein